MKAHLIDRFKSLIEQYPDGVTLKQVCSELRVSSDIAMAMVNQHGMTFEAGRYRVNTAKKEIELAQMLRDELIERGDQHIAVHEAAEFLGIRTEQLPEVVKKCRMLCTVIMSDGKVWTTNATRWAVLLELMQNNGDQMTMKLLEQCTGWDQKKRGNAFRDLRAQGHDVFFDGEVYWLRGEPARVIDAEPETLPDPQPIVEIEPELTVEPTDPAPAAPEPEPVMQPEPDPVIEIEPETAVEPELEPESLADAVVRWWVVLDKYGNRVGGFSESIEAAADDIFRSVEELLCSGHSFQQVEVSFRPILTVRGERHDA